MGVVNTKTAFKAMGAHETTKGMTRQKRGPRTKPWDTLLIKQGREQRRWQRRPGVTIISVFSLAKLV